MPVAPGRGGRPGGPERTTGTGGRAVPVAAPRRLPGCRPGAGRGARRLAHRGGPGADPGPGPGQRAEPGDRPAAIRLRSTGRTALFVRRCSTVADPPSWPPPAVPSRCPTVLPPAPRKGSRPATGYAGREASGRHATDGGRCGDAPPPPAASAARRDCPAACAPWRRTDRAARRSPAAGGPTSTARPRTWPAPPAVRASAARSRCRENAVVVSPRSRRSAARR